MSVSFFLLPCSKWYLDRAYLDTIQMTLLIVLTWFLLSPYILHLLFSFLQVVKFILLARRFKHNTKHFFCEKFKKFSEFNVDISLIDENFLYRSKTSDSNGIFLKGFRIILSVVSRIFAQYINAKEKSVSLSF